MISKIPGIRHDFGTAQVPIDHCEFQNWESRKPFWKQTHGTQVTQVLGPHQECGETDSLWTSTKSLPLGVVTADCVPIFFAAKKGGAIAAVHSGWRGTMGHIILKTWNSLQGFRPDPEDWAVAIGPSIGPCCYEVDFELAHKFSLEFVGYPPSLWEARQKNSKPHLDLGGILLAELKTLGFKDIDLMRQCTYCTPQNKGGFQFNSFRRDATRLRQYSIIEITD